MNTPYRPPAGQSSRPGSHPDGLTALVFRGLYREYDLVTIGITHVVTPKGTPVLISDSLGQIARQLSDPEPGPARPGTPAGNSPGK